MTKKRKALSIMTFLMVSFMLATCIVHADSFSTIDFEEYSKTIINEYAKYGVTIEMEPLPNTSYTKELLQKELNKVENNVEQIKKIENAPIVISDDTSDIGIIPRAMYYDKNCSATVIKGMAPIMYTVKVTAKLQLDAQRDNIVKGYKPTLKMTSAIGYADYISYKSHTLRIDNSSSKAKNRNATYTIKAEVKEEISISGVSAWAKHTDTLMVSLRPFK